MAIVLIKVVLIGVMVFFSLLAPVQKKTLDEKNYNYKMLTPAQETLFQVS